MCGLHPLGAAVSGGCFFFFSSRRRHTRLTCDWSSDVCSSDLEAARGILAEDDERLVRALAGERLERRDDSNGRLRPRPQREAALGLERTHGEDRGGVAEGTLELSEQRGKRGGAEASVPEGARR